MPTDVNQPGSTPPAPTDAPTPDAPAPAPVDANPSPKHDAPERITPTHTAAQSPANVKVAPQPQTAAGPVPIRDRSMAWMILLALLALSALPLYTTLHAFHPQNPTHDTNLQITAESWRQRHRMYHGDISLESIAPVHHGEPLLDQPPGFVWINQIAFTSLDPLLATDADLDYQMRLMSVSFALLTIAAVFWAGFSVGGLKTASFAALTILACPLLTWYARAGIPDVTLVGLEALAIASAMWALRPLRPSPSVSRQAVGWLICGIALGLTVLTGGPATLPLVLLPILVISIMCPHRVNHLLGLVASLFIAGLIVMPWVLYVHGQDTDIWKIWVSSVWPETMTSAAAFGRAFSDRGILALVLLLPWSFWLIASLAQPFSASSAGVRRRVFIGWAWFLSVLLLVITGPGTQGLPGLLPIIPAAAILIGQCLRLFSDLSAEARHARIWRFTRWPHIILFTAASIALPLGMAFQSTLVQRGILNQPVAAPMTWYFWLGLSACLLLITALSTRFALRHYPGKAIICWSAWAVVFMSVMLIPLARGPLNNPYNTIQTPAPTTPSVTPPGGP